jgi:hypothetical protein
MDPLKLVNSTLVSWILKTLSELNTAQTGHNFIVNVLILIQDVQVNGIVMTLKLFLLML